MSLPPPVDLNKLAEETTVEVDKDVDEIEQTEEGPEVEQPKSRGRGRPKSTAAPRKTAARKKEDTKNLGKQIVGIHMLASIASGFPELAISDDEGERLADAIHAVADEYGLNFSGKTGAAMQLFAAAGMVYAPRAFKIKARLDKMKKAQLTLPVENPDSENPRN